MSSNAPNSFILSWKYFFRTLSSKPDQLAMMKRFSSKHAKNLSRSKQIRPFRNPTSKLPPNTFLFNLPLACVRSALETQAEFLRLILHHQLLISNEPPVQRSEMVFKLLPALKAFPCEILPSVLAIPLSTLLEGAVVASNRQQFLTGPISCFLGLVIEPNTGVYASIALWSAPAPRPPYLAMLFMLAGTKFQGLGSQKPTRLSDDSIPRRHPPPGPPSMLRIPSYPARAPWCGRARRHNGWKMCGTLAESGGKMPENWAE
jgi:hypothetical protein